MFQLIRNNRRGMTLVEIMIVIAIIGGLMAVLLPQILGKMDKAKAKEGKIQLGQIVNALNMFYTDCGKFPTSGAGLNALVKAPSADECAEWGPDPYLKESMLKDPWKKEFIYESDGSTFTLKSLGRDGRDGGTGYDKDITSDEL